MSYYDHKPPRPPAWAFLVAMVILTIIYYATVGTDHTHWLLQE